MATNFAFLPVQNPIEPLGQFLIAKSRMPKARPICVRRNNRFIALVGFRVGQRIQAPGAVDRRTKTLRYLDGGNGVVNGPRIPSRSAAPWLASSVPARFFLRLRCSFRQRRSYRAAVRAYFLEHTFLLGRNFWLEGRLNNVGNCTSNRGGTVNVHRQKSRAAHWMP